MPLSANRNTITREGSVFSKTAGTTIYAGSMVSLNDEGQVIPATSEGNKVFGVVRSFSEPSQMVNVYKGLWKMENSTNNPVVISDVGFECYVEDDFIVTGSPSILSDTGEVLGAKAIAGTVVDIDSDGIWVKFD